MKNLNNTKKYIDNLNKSLKKFEKYYEFLVSYNEKVNLTAITEKEDVFIKHFLDSILTLDYIPNNAKVVDVGTGAGFPGFPLKIVRDDINLTLVDSLNKRVEFLKQLAQKLGYECNNPLVNSTQNDKKDIQSNIINIVHSRAEDFCKLNREKFDVAVARAVAKLNTLLEYLLPLVKFGGLVFAYKSSNSDEELIEAKNAISIFGGEYIDTLHFELPNEKGSRNIIVIKKVKETPIKYPRDKNLPKLKPIR